VGLELQAERWRGCGYGVDVDIWEWRWDRSGDICRGESGICAVVLARDDLNNGPEAEENVYKHFEVEFWFLLALLFVF